MMMMTDNDPLPIAQVWDLAESLKIGQTFVIEWRTVANASRTGQRWKEKRGVILQACVRGGAGKQRYASVQFEGMVRPAMFPEDGANGTQNLEYRCVELEDAEVFTPSPEKSAAADQLPLCPAMPDSNLRPPLPNPRVRAMVEEARMLEEVPDDDDAGDESDEEATVGPETCLDPAKWIYISRREMDVMRSQAWLREYFAPLVHTKSPAENIIFADLIAVLCADVATVRRLPEISHVGEWITGRERLLARLLIQMERVEGASTAQLNALQRGFTNRKQPEWVRSARETGAHMLAHPDPLRASSRQEGKSGRKKATHPKA
jgi:hypothetical protein